MTIGCQYFGDCCEEKLGASHFAYKTIGVACVSGHIVDSGDQDDGQRRTAGFNGFGELRSGHAGHHLIGEDKIDAAGGEQFEGFPAGFGGQNPVTLSLQYEAAERSWNPFVVDDEDRDVFSGHGNLR